MTPSPRPDYGNPQWWDKTPPRNAHAAPVQYPPTRRGPSRRETIATWCGVVGVLVVLVVLLGFGLVGVAGFIIDQLPVTLPR